MFGNSQSREQLEKQLRKLLAEAYDLSHSDRKKSAMKMAEADEIQKKLDALEKVS